MVEVLLFGLLVFVFALIIRVIVHLVKREPFGVDAWYYLLVADEIKKNKRMPPKLSCYLLDEEKQYYPPGFFILLSLLPKKFLREYNWLISPLIDCIQMYLLYLFSYLFTQNIVLSLAAAVIYSITSTLIWENLNLNSRSFGNILFTINVILLIFYLENNSYLFLILLVLSGISILFTHKMSTQAMVFIFIGFSIVYKSYSLILILITIFITKK